MTDRTPLILVPGLLCDSLLWANQIGALGDLADCQVANPVNHDSIKGMASDVLHRTPFPRFALAGLSMGGYVALEIMRQAPDRVLKLALLDTSARPDTREQTERRQALIRMAQNGKFELVVQTLIPALLGRARSEDPPIVGAVRTMARNVGIDAFYRQEAAIIGRIDSRPFLPSIQCATLLVCGRQDAITPVELHQELAGGIKGSILKIIDDCGHLSTMERPEHVSACLREWLTN